MLSGAELVVHAYPDGRAPGRDRLDRLGLSSTVLPTPGISEDAAMLLAYEKGAELIVAVGTRFNLIEFLERNRAGMSSTFLTRLKVGEKLVDARGVSRLFRPRVGVGMVLAFTLAAVRGRRGRADRLARAARPRLHARRAPAVSRRDRMSRVEATGELESERRDVWALVAEPYHLPDWWPAYTGVEPDRRGLAENARWQVDPQHLPGPPPQAGGRRGVIVMTRVLGGRGSCSWHDPKQGIDAGVLLDNAGTGRTRATTFVAGPWLPPCPRGSPRPPGGGR